MTAVLSVRKQLNRIPWNLKNRCPTKPIRSKLVCEQNVFCYLDVRSYLKALKSTFAFEIHRKKHLPTPTTAAKKKQ